MGFAGAIPMNIGNIDPSSADKFAHHRNPQQTIPNSALPGIAQLYSYVSGLQTTYFPELPLA
jgi:hypothetical protein